MTAEQIELVKALLPTSLGSEEIRTAIAADILRQSVFSARMENARYLAQVRTVCAQVAGGGMNLADARMVLKRTLRNMGHDTANARGITDPASRRRLDLIVKTRSAMASNAAAVNAQDEYSVYAEPAWELIRFGQRRVPRDWVDTITCAEDIQPLGLLAWAANGKDLGLTPNYILEMCARTNYARPEFEMAIRNAADYDLADLSSKWHEMIWRARDMVKLLPPAEVGKAVMTKEGDLFKGDADALVAALAAGELEFHEGTIGGAWPRIIS